MNQPSIEPWLEAISMRPRTRRLPNDPCGRWEDPVPLLSYNTLKHYNSTAIAHYLCKSLWEFNLSIVMYSCTAITIRDTKPSHNNLSTSRDKLSPRLITYCMNPIPAATYLQLKYYEACRMMKYFRLYSRVKVRLGIHLSSASPLTLNVLRR